MNAFDSPRSFVPAVAGAGPDASVVVIGPSAPGVAFDAGAFGGLRVFVVGPDTDPDWLRALYDRIAEAAPPDWQVVSVGGDPADVVVPAAVARRLQRLDGTVPPSFADWIACTIGSVEAGDVLPGRVSDVRFGLSVRTLDDVSWCRAVVSRTFGLSAEAAVGIGELLLNAVEHGNLGISFEEKSALLASGKWFGEIMQRLDAPGYRDRRVAVDACSAGGRIEIRIRDEGEGFDWRSYVGTGPVSPDCHHGRGIAMARSAGFASFEYTGCGNEVVVTV